jgi:hypothetical protein
MLFLSYQLITNLKKYVKKQFKVDKARRVQGTKVITASVSLTESSQFTSTIQLYWPFPKRAMDWDRDQNINLSQVIIKVCHKKTSFTMFGSENKPKE